MRSYFKKLENDSFLYFVHFVVCLCDQFKRNQSSNGLLGGGSTGSLNGGILGGFVPSPKAPLKSATPPKSTKINKVTKPNISERVAFRELHDNWTNLPLQDPDFGEYYYFISDLNLDIRSEKCIITVPEGELVPKAQPQMVMESQYEMEMPKPSQLEAEISEMHEDVQSALVIEDEEEKENVIQDEYSHTTAGMIISEDEELIEEKDDDHDMIEPVNQSQDNPDVQSHDLVDRKAPSTVHQNALNEDDDMIDAEARELAIRMQRLWSEQWIAKTELAPEGTLLTRDHFGSVAMLWLAF